MNQNIFNILFKHKKQVKPVGLKKYITVVKISIPLLDSSAIQKQHGNTVANVESVPELLRISSFITVIYVQMTQFSKPASALYKAKYVILLLYRCLYTSNLSHKHGMF